MSKGDEAGAADDPHMADDPAPADDRGQAGHPEQADDLPWWLAGDATYAGARPLFDPAAAPEAQGEVPTDHQSTDGDSGTPRNARNQVPPSADAAGSTIAEALKFAGAVAAWSNETGLTDTLKSLWEEATESMAATAQSAAGAPKSDAEPEAQDATTGPEQTGQDDAPPPVHLRIVTSPTDETPTTCDFCPLCQGYEVLRQVQPQMSEGLAEAMASLTAALNLALDSLSGQQRRT